MSSIIRAVDEQIDATQCGGNENCKDEKRWMTHDLWTSLNHRIFDYLEGVSLQHLVSAQQDQKVAVISQPASKRALEAGI